MSIQQQVEAPDITELKELLAEYIELFASPEYSVDADEKFKADIVETVVEAFYGKDIFNWINKVCE